MNPLQRETARRRTVLCLSGHDPSGGAGLQADVLAIHAQGAHALSVPTVLTAQDSLNVQQVFPQAVSQLDRAARCLIDDIPIHAIKIGLLGDAEQVRWAAALTLELGVPAVLDPVLRAGGGQNLVEDAAQMALLQDLLPVVTIATPNAAEARRLAPDTDSIDDCAEQLMRSGCKHILVTGGDEADETVINRWYNASGLRRRFEWVRWPHGFRGAGCSLASALAARMALGDPLETALERAQAWTHDALGKAYGIGHGRLIPDRR